MLANVTLCEKYTLVVNFINAAYTLVVRLKSLNSVASANMLVCSAVPPTTFNLGCNESCTAVRSVRNSGHTAKSVSRTMWKGMVERTYT